MKISNEIKAGLVIVVAIAIGVMFFAKTVTFLSGTYKLKTFFKHAGDLKTDAIVKLAGIEVGRVKEINFVYQPDTKVECVLEVSKDAKVRIDSIAYIGTAGFVGDAYVGLTGGSFEEFFVPGDIVQSEEPLQTRLLLKKADNIATNLDRILIDIKTLVVDNRENLDDILNNLTVTTENFKEFSTDLKKHPWKLLFKGE